MAGALLFVEKIRQRAALFLRDIGLFYSRAEIQRTIVDFLAFMEHGLAENIAIRAHTNRNPNKQKVFQKFITKIYKIKNLQRLMTFLRPIQ